MRRKCPIPGYRPALREREPLRIDVAGDVRERGKRCSPWVLADHFEGEPVTANALNDGYVLTDLRGTVTGRLKVLVAFTGLTAPNRAR